MLKRNINLRIHGHHPGKVYTTGSPVAGEAAITPAEDVEFASVQIMFTGISWTRLDSFPHSSDASYTFLELDMPIPESLYAPGRVFKANHTYTFGFNFCVPYNLTINQCSSDAGSSRVHTYHERLPPSLGCWKTNDLAPSMTGIEYAVQARVILLPKANHKLLKKLAAVQPVNVLPGYPEDPPFHTTTEDSRYVLSRSKTFRRALFSEKQGRLVAAVTQPAAVQLEADGRVSEGTNRAVLLNLTFTPVSPGVIPPESLTIAGKIEAQTWYSSRLMKNLPDLGSTRDELGLRQEACYSTTVHLSSVTKDRQRWTTTDSGCSYSAATSMPILLPRAKFLFVPSFYTGLIARTYTLYLAVEAERTKINLAVPLQIVVRSPNLPYSLSMDEDLPSFDAVVERRRQRNASNHPVNDVLHHLGDHLVKTCPGLAFKTTG